jgi:ATP-dependent RNA helicase DeaD
VGRVDIRESFAVVEVASAVAERVIRALNGTTMRGRSLRVDFDRKNAGGPAREGRPPRGGGDRPRPRGAGPPGRQRPPER